MRTIRSGLHNPQQAHQVLSSVWHAIKPELIAGRPLHLEVRPERRSDAANRKMWATLHDIAAQVDWHGQKLAPEDWKDMLTASLKKQRAVPGIDGGFVILGERTRDMSREEMSEVIELALAFGAQRGVKFGDEYE